MDRQYSWKRTEDIEIDLADMLKKFCRQWKKTAACALAAAVVFGGYGWIRSREKPDADEFIVAEEAELTEEEEQAVTDAVRLKNDIRDLETYLDHSILMQLDPYHKTRRIMLYSIDRADRKELPRIMESYLSFVSNGGAADMLAEHSSRWKMDKSFLAEVISSYQKTYSFPYQIVVDSTEDGVQETESLFYVEVTGKNASAAEKMALDMQDVLKEYSEKVRKTAGGHRLMLVSSMESITADGGLQTQQNDKNAQLSSYKETLKAQISAFSKEQKAVYKMTATVEEEEGELSGETVTDENMGSVMKFILLGLVGGAFAYCCIFSCRYLFDGRVKSIEEIKRMYTFPCFGGIMIPDKIRKKGRNVPEAQKGIYEHSTAQAMNRIRLACKNQGIQKFCAASGRPLDVVEKECLESMAGQLKNWEIDMEVAENTGVDTKAWDSLAETGNVLMICRTDETTHRMIDDEMNFYLENGIAVIGAVAFLRHE